MLRSDNPDSPRSLPGGRIDDCLLFKEMLERANKYPWVETFLRGSKLETNNILVYLEATFSRMSQAALFPDGRPEEKYGATFGPLNNVAEVPAKDFDTDRQAIPYAIESHFHRQNFSNGLILMTSSGFSLDSRYEGPHVGSYHNARFKQVLLRSDAPTAILLDETRFNRPFDPDQCYRICGPGDSWQSIAGRKPLAVAASFRDEALADRVCNWMDEKGLQRVHRRKDGRITSVICANKAFQDLLAPPAARSNG